MDVFGNLFEVIWKLAIPVGGLSFLMVWWALRKGVLSETGGLKALGKEIEAMGKLHKDKKKESPRVNPLHGKWLKFGGGFYGTVALYTYGLIEWVEIRETIERFGGFSSFIGELSINLFINMFINGLMNFIAAISWPVYWIREFGSNHMWIWFLVAYGAYWLGMRMAQWLVLKERSG
ncbi:MAG: hypothetical protein KJO85_08740 [Gammaproteobacteria bacterium]|nr:hypothetical protein [Gammaproteobacteria bacterium]